MTTKTYFSPDLEGERQRRRAITSSNNHSEKNNHIVSSYVKVAAYTVS